jgi:hypothetical protein
MKQLVVKATAIACTIAAASCAANSQFTRVHQSNRTTASHAARIPQNFPHGALIESGSTLMISEGNNHAAFPPGTKLVRTADGIVVTYKGVTRTFSSNAHVDVGTYRRYAKPGSP